MALANATHLTLDEDHLMVGHSDREGELEAYGALPKQAKVALAREQEANKNSLEGRVRIVDVIPAEQISKEALLIHARLMAGLRVIKLSGARAPGKAGSLTEQARRAQKVVRVSWIIVAAASLVLMQAVFMAGYNLHQQDENGLFRAGVQALISLVVALTAFASLHRLREVWGAFFPRPTRDVSNLAIKSGVGRVAARGWRGGSYHPQHTYLDHVGRHAPRRRRS